jgi:TetR/AcrR family transcriptional regulator
MPFRKSLARKPGTRGEPEKTRAAILKAALHEFASEGIAGARTDAIARLAGVNKALLYYYFKDKEALHGSVLDFVFEGMRDQLLSVLDQAGSPRQRIINYVTAHFDYVASSPYYPRLVQQELMRTGRRKSPHLKRIVQKYLTPIYDKLSEVMSEGIRNGDFRRVEVRGFVICMAGAVQHYFNTIPYATAIGTPDPLAQEAVAAQRNAVLDFVSSALLTSNHAH